MRLFKVTACEWDTCLPDPRWRESIQPMLSTRCKAMCILPEHVESDPHIAVQSERGSRLSAPEALIGRLKTGVPWKLIRRDVAEELKLQEQGFKLFPVVLNGVATQDYCSYSQPFRSRLLDFSAYVHSAAFCSGCGNLGASFDLDAEPRVWGACLRDPLSDFRNPTWKSRQVYTSSSGWGFFVRENVVDGLTPSLRKELKIMECRVVDF